MSGEGVGEEKHAAKVAANAHPEAAFIVLPQLLERGKEHVVGVLHHPVRRKQSLIRRRLGRSEESRATEEMCRRYFSSILPDLDPNAKLGAHEKKAPPDLSSRSSDRFWRIICT
jgi:hypothetical protein